MSVVGTSFSEEGGLEDCSFACEVEPSDGGDLTMAFEGSVSRLKTDKESFKEIGRALVESDTTRDLAAEARMVLWGSGSWERRSLPAF